MSTPGLSGAGQDFPERDAPGQVTAPAAPSGTGSDVSNLDTTEQTDGQTPGEPEPDGQTGERPSNEGQSSSADEPAKVGYLAGVRAELAAVSWAPRRQVALYTGVVAAFTTVSVLVIAGVDAVVSGAVLTLLGAPGH